MKKIVHLHLYQHFLHQLLVIFLVFLGHSCLFFLHILHPEDELIHSSALNSVLPVLLGKIPVYFLLYICIFLYKYVCIFLYYLGHIPLCMNVYRNHYSLCLQLLPCSFLFPKNLSFFSLPCSFPKNGWLIHLVNPYCLIMIWQNFPVTTVKFKFDVIFLSLKIKCKAPRNWKYGW